MTRSSWNEIVEKCRGGARLNRQDGLVLLQDAPLSELGQVAHELRTRRAPADQVTYVIDSNPNYTNICTTDCAFCAFYRKPGHSEGYTLSVEQVMERVGRAAELGATTVLLQGGHNPDLPLDYYVSLVRETCRRFPDVTPHYFTASEIHQMAKVSNLSVREVLQQLKDAGQSSIPGGGAEVLSDRIRLKVAAKKGGADTWLEVHRTAHQLGYRSTATMMYGHIEEDEDLIEHFERIRELQDETRGFTAFVPWSYKKGNTPMQARIDALGRKPAGAARYCRILAASRLYLDNFDHVQASWFSEGKKTGQIALHYGADDFGGTIFEENVHLATGHEVKTTVEEIRTLIREAGFTPVQRTTHYTPIG
ncbi:MAG: dehypoxanthine futalosine cyclase [Candidatus Eisenbacteria bacterium]|nr:dehypoxanthine futalosine cyclase [Candidatus Eisenbacteria bacterium]MCC7143801.1 dehypoxanthine futalosine cyclase [Candidatus Eisenbacteria bacterium]